MSITVEGLLKCVPEVKDCYESIQKRVQIKSVVSRTWYNEDGWWIVVTIGRVLDV